MKILFLIFWVISILFSIRAVPFYIPTNHVQGSNFSHIHQHLLNFVVVVVISHSSKYVVIPHCGLICISLTIEEKKVLIVFTIIKNYFQKILIRNKQTTDWEKYISSIYLTKDSYLSYIKKFNKLVYIRRSNNHKKP